MPSGINHALCASTACFEEGAGEGAVVGGGGEVASEFASGEVGVARKEGVDLGFVFFGFDGTGGVDEASARFDLGGEVV